MRRLAAVVPAAGSAAMLALAAPTTALSGEAAASPPHHVGEVVVTAQKREQSANSVGMAITTATGEVLQTRGITSVADLPRLVPGLTVQESAYNSTSFTLRGVGFFNSDLSTPPAVTIYVDEAPLPYPAMAKLVAFDLARVEVLKGPQGTLFGQNATGGAVNYIAAKPTPVFAGGVDASFGRFNRAQLGGFISGPLAEDMTARVAVQARRGDAWQKSISRPGDRLGRIDELQGRATLDWRPRQDFTSLLTLTVTHDESESAAAQFLAPAPLIPPLAAPGLLTFPVVGKPRAADWTPVRPDTNTTFPYRSDTTLYQANWRSDYQLSDAVAFTSLTSYSHFRLAYGQDPDGTPFHIDEILDRDGEVSSLFQELRATGRQGRLRWLLGANYAHDEIKDAPVQYFSDNDVAYVFQALDPLALADRSVFTAHVRAKTYAAFARLEYEASDRLLVEAAVRYNVDHRDFDNCSLTATDSFAKYWNAFRGGALPPTRVGDCYVLDPANALRPVENVHNELDEESVSWRAGFNWSARPDLLVFAHASKGFKAGAVPVLAASTTAQFVPVKQESVVAYEIGFKAALLDRRVQLNASAFYYHYKDKQLRGAVLDPVFGPLEALVSIPKSHVEGVEMQLVARPLEGLTIDTSATYVKTEIDRFTGFDGRANFGDQAGTPFPFSPRWQSVTHIDYEVSVAPGVTAFAGGSLTYNSDTYSGVGALEILQIDGFALLDLRAGVALRDGRYRIWAWGRNVTNAYYWNNVFANANAISRFVGQPATYGISISGRF